MTKDNARANYARKEPFQSTHEAPEKSGPSSGPSALAELKGATATSSLMNFKKLLEFPPGLRRRGRV